MHISNYKCLPVCLLFDFNCNFDHGNEFSSKHYYAKKCTQVPKSACAHAYFFAFNLIEKSGKYKQKCT